MKKRDILYIATTNDEFETVVFVEKTGVALAKKLGVHKSSLCHCIIDKYNCAGYKVSVVDMSTDLKPNTYEDYIEYCKFEKIKPDRLDSLIEYKKQIDIDCANGYFYGEI